VINRAVYRANGSGYIDFNHPQHIWVVNAPRTGDEKVTPKQLTKGHFDDGSAVWSKDSSRLYFDTDYTDEPYYELPRTDLYSIPVTGGERAKLTSVDMGAVAFVVSPNGKQVAFIAQTSQPVRSYTQPDLWVMDLDDNAKPRNLTADFDFDIGGGLTGDNVAPRGGTGNFPVWSADGRSISMIYVKEGKANIGSFDCRNRQGNRRHERQPGGGQFPHGAGCVEVCAPDLNSDACRRSLLARQDRRPTETTDTCQR
jgi:Tol biopolymer transport system component